MNATTADLFAAYRLLGEEAFVAMVVASKLSDARILELTAQVLNLPPRPAVKVDEKARAFVKNSRNAGHAEAYIEVAGV